MNDSGIEWLPCKHCQSELNPVQYPAEREKPDNICPGCGQGRQKSTQAVKAIARSQQGYPGKPIPDYYMEEFFNRGAVWTTNYSPSTDIMHLILR